MMHESCEVVHFNGQQNEVEQRRPSWQLDDDFFSKIDLSDIEEDQSFLAWPLLYEHTMR